MSKFDTFKEKTGKIIGKIVDGSRITESEKMKPINKSVSTPSQQASVTNEKMEMILQMLAEQEEEVIKLGETAARNDTKINLIYEQLMEQKSTFTTVGSAINEQEDIMKAQLVALKEDNQQCVNQLKDMIAEKGGPDVAVVEDIIKSNMDEVMKQQRTNTLETGRTIMTVKTSLEKDVEQIEDNISNVVKSIMKKSDRKSGVLLVITIMNFLLLVGYIVYELLIKGNFL